jgi:hypothetical protein
MTPRDGKVKRDRHGEPKDDGSDGSLDDRLPNERPSPGTGETQGQPYGAAREKANDRAQRGRLKSQLPLGRRRGRDGQRVEERQHCHNAHQGREFGVAKHLCKRPGDSDDDGTQGQTKKHACRRDCAEMQFIDVADRDQRVGGRNPWDRFPESKKHHDDCD